MLILVYSIYSITRNKFRCVISILVVNIGRPDERFHNFTQTCIHIKLECRPKFKVIKD